MAGASGRKRKGFTSDLGGIYPRGGYTLRSPAFIPDDPRLIPAHVMTMAEIRKRYPCSPSCPLCQARAGVDHVESEVLPPFMHLGSSRLARVGLSSKGRMPGSEPGDRGSNPRGPAIPDHVFDDFWEEAFRVPRLTITWKNGRERRRLEWVEAR